jgi:hypothetical protein
MPLALEEFVIIVFGVVDRRIRVCTTERVFTTASKLFHPAYSKFVFIIFAIDRTVLTWLEKQCDCTKN